MIVTQLPEIFDLHVQKQGERKIIKVHGQSTMSSEMKIGIERDSLQNTFKLSIGNPINPDRQMDFDSDQIHF